MWIAIELSQYDATPAALPVLRWYYKDEFVPAHQVFAATALARLKGKDAAVLRAELATRPHPNLFVVLTTLKQIRAPKETLPADKLRPLCHHHRQTVREAARALNQQQGGGDPGPFDPVKAMRSPALESLMKKLGGLLIDMPPADAPFIVVSMENQSVFRRGPTIIKGWLIKQDDRHVELFSQFGWKESFSTANCTVARPKIEEEVAAVEAIRKTGDKGFEFSENGGFSGQFRGQAASLTELLLAQRLFTVGKLNLASRVLFPALETLHRDEDAVDVVRQELGRVVGYQMLAAFAGDRDYKRTARLAESIIKTYPDTIFHEYAVGLAAQLPRRGDDFVKLKLPTPAEWEGLKKKLTRAEQIDFLCERMRLLNCFQTGQGGYRRVDPFLSTPVHYFGGNFKEAMPTRLLSGRTLANTTISAEGLPAGLLLSATQFAEPGYISRDASFGGGGRTEVINPLVVLCGMHSWTIKDVPQLSKYLRDDWYIPTVTFWRNFHPSRKLHHTRPLFAHMINQLAGRDLCEIDRWRKLHAAQIDKEIARIARWARENSERTRLELEWMGLEDMIAKGATWREVEDRVQGLLKQKQPRAFEVMKRFLQDKRTDDWENQRILELYKEQIDRASAVKDLEHANEAVRICAAVVTMGSDKSPRARKILGDALEKRGLEWWTQSAVEALLAEGSPEARREVVRLFAYKDLHLQKTVVLTLVFRGEIMRKCADAGMVEPYRYYLKQLDNDALVPTPPGYAGSKLTWKELHVAEIGQEFAAGNAEVKEITSQSRTLLEQLPAMKKWLQRRIKEITAKQKR